MSERVYHLAHKIRPDGAVSPWCAKKPRALNLASESWVMEYDRSTCPRCKAAYRESNRPDAELPVELPQCNCGYTSGKCAVDCPRQKGWPDDPLKELPHGG